MRILVFGAGVLGSLFAARLHDAGHDVTILARGERLASIREHGIVVRDEAAGVTSTSLVPAVERLEPDDRYDAILAFVRREQRLDALPALVANASPTVVFMGNDASGAADLRSALGDRLVLGFGMAGGTIEDGVAHARVGRTASPTVLGEPDGTRSERARELATVLASAGIPATVTPSIDAWLRTHAAVVVPLAEAIYAAGGDVRRLAATPDLLLLTIRAVRETFAVLRATDIPITPAVYGRILALPERLLAAGLARAFATDAADLMTARHAMHAREEMAALDADLARLAEATGVETPSLDRLRAWLDPAQAPMEEGSRTLVVAHPVRAAAFTAASAAAGIALALVVLRRTRPDLVSGLTVARLRALSGIEVERVRALSGIDTRIKAAEGLVADLPSMAVLLGRLPSRRDVLPLVVRAAGGARPRLTAAAAGATEAMRGARSWPRPSRRLGLPVVALILPLAVAGAVGLLLASPRRVISRAEEPGEGARIAEAPATEG